MTSGTSVVSVTTPAGWVALAWFTLACLAGASASFSLEGTRTSYAQFRKWYPTRNGTIEFEFMTGTPDGVLLYTDDGGYYDFVEIKLVSGTVRLRYNWGDGARVLTAGKDLHIGRIHHKVRLIRNDSLTLLAVDDDVASSDGDAVTVPTAPVLGHQPHGPGGDTNFGNYSTNSYVYMGGLPSWYSTKLSSLALPSVVFEPRFRGSIRNLLYADDASGRPRVQELMAYKVGKQKLPDFALECGLGEMLHDNVHRYERIFEYDIFGRTRCNRTTWETTISMILWYKA